MPQNLLISFLFHISVIIITIISFPFIAKKPIEIPPLVSIELIQITDQTNIPFAPKAEKIIEKVKKEGDLGLKELVQNFDKIKLNKIEELYISKNILKLKCLLLIIQLGIKIIPCPLFRCLEPLKIRISNISIIFNSFLVRTFLSILYFPL